MKNRIVIVGNGTVSHYTVALITPEDFVIGVDRAAYWLIKQGRIPNVAIGDFDSVTETELRIIQQSVRDIQQFPKEKNQTDMELAVDYAIHRKPASVRILGGIGSRMDHTMATWEVLDRIFDAHIPHELMNETNRIQLVGRGRTILVSGGEYRYVSIIPFTQSISLTLSGFRYNLLKTTVTRGTTRGVSNEITGEHAVITIFSGKAWLIESND
jgi:thiamine pyrophosphokinase